MPVTFAPLQARNRLTPTDRGKELLPLRRARGLDCCKLYWFPVSSSPAPSLQRAWLLQFLDRWSARMTTQAGLREELFLQFKAVDSLKNAFLNRQQDFFPVLGLGRRPGAGLPQPPSTEEIRSMSKQVLDQGKPADVNSYMPDYCYWFAKKAARQQREVFAGCGALTIVFLEPDAAAGPPKLPAEIGFLKDWPELRKFDLDAALATASAMQDSFLPKSKELFGAGLENEPCFKGLLFIVPLLTSGDFFTQPAEVERLFQFADVYINESPADYGVLLAFQKDFEEDLITILREMRSEGLEYPQS